VKRRDLIRKIEEAGAVFIRHGGKHDWYQNPKTKVAQPVPRHTEINELLARSIIRKLS
jgi:predicted RNA binding protein YcfA (HicA-like mRNA interferase family)